MEPATSGSSAWAVNSSSWYRGMAGWGSELVVHEEAESRRSDTGLGPKLIRAGQCKAVSLFTSASMYRLAFG